MSRIVVSLGEFAFVDDSGAGSPDPNAHMEHEDRVQLAARTLVPLVTSGHQIIVCHGDDTLVGLINLVFELDSRKKVAPDMPFAECTSMCEGYMGFHLAQAIDNLLQKSEPQKVPSVAILTQAIVEKDPERMERIGPRFTQEEAQNFMKETGNTYTEGLAGSWQREYPSAKPVGFREEAALRALLANHAVIIAAGGGGIPMAHTEDGFEEVGAVVEVDYAAEKLAEILDADCLLFLCADNVVLPSVKNELPCTSAEIRSMIDTKAQSDLLNAQLDAAAQFADSGPRRRAVVSHFGDAAQAVDGRAGIVVE